MSRVQLQHRTTPSLRNDHEASKLLLTVRPYTIEAMEWYPILCPVFYALRYIFYMNVNMNLTNQIRSLSF